MKKTFTLFILFLWGFQGFTQTSWTPHTSNPVMPASFDVKSKRIYAPRIFYDGTNYHMYYSRSYGNTNKECIGYARSANGTTWTLIDTAVIKPSTISSRFDFNSASQPWVIKDGNTFKMWYKGQGPNGGNIGYATSPDGATWTKVDGTGANMSVYDRATDGSITSPGGLGAPSVIKDGPVYKMWYTRNFYKFGGNASSIAYATSPDGLTWNNVPGPGANGAMMDIGLAGTFDENFMGFPSVILNNGLYQMWYTGVDNPGGNRIGYAASPNGLTWTKVAGNGAKGSVIDNGLHPMVLESGTGYKMWYSAALNSKLINYATSGLVAGIPERLFQTTALNQNYPNPFNQVTTIPYEISRPAEVSLKIFDLQGRVIKKVVQNRNTSGKNSFELTAENIPSGIYFYQLQVGQELSRIRKMIIEK